MANPQADAPRPQIEAEVALVDLLLSPPGGLQAFVRRQRMLDATYVDTLSRDQRSLTVAYRMHALPRMLRRVSRMLWGLSAARGYWRRDPVANAGPRHR
jgi:hypothetical protein